MKFAKKLAALLVAAALVFSLAACQKEAIVETEEEVKTTEAPKEETTKAAETEAETKADDGGEEAPADNGNDYGVDLSEEVTLVVYMMGDEPTDMDKVEDALNEKLLEKFNTKLDFQFSSWTDYTTHYNNMLTTGSADIAYTANWLSYAQLAAVGAFTDLEPLLKDYAPELSELYTEDELNACRVGGTMYCIPNLWPESVTEGVAYRKDLCDKYNLPEPIETTENVEAYLQGLVDAGYEDPILFNISSGATTETWPTSATALMHYLEHPGYRELNYGYMYNNNDPYNPVEYWHTDAFVEDAKLMKKWADAGYWTRSALSAENDTQALAEGRTTIFADGTNPNKWVSWVKGAKDAGHDDYEIAWWSFANVDDYAYPAHPTQNATVIVNTCKYPERAMLIINDLMTNVEDNYIIQYGIEGVHYELDENGFYKNLDTAYGYEAANTWCWRNGPIKLQQESDVALQEAMDADEVLGSDDLYPNINIPQGFSEDYTDYEAERTAIMNVVDQYLNPIMAGLVDDPEAACADFIQKVDAAGLEKVSQSYIEQWHEYCDTYGYTASK